MRRRGNATRADILEAAYRLFRQRGFARVAMSDIAAGAAVTRRTLYRHFDSKDALLAAMFEIQLARSTKSFLAMILADAPVETLVEALFADLADWSAAERWTGSGFTRVAVELADLPGHPARRLARRHKATMERALADRFLSLGTPDAEALAREVWVLLEGAMVLTLIHGDRAYAETAGAAACRLCAARLRR